ncbi:uncharacterized protein LOC135144904 [Zophobas morio]|uniref:uncharacterized protein LOC135144904 n=1 Tax=Zophobas morio TaxID=2755281 RepID=UPI003082E0DC
MEQRQVNVYSIKEVKDCNCESFWWLDICSLKATVYRIPLLLSSNLEENTSYKDPVNLSEYLDNRNKLVAKKEVKPSSPEEICYDLIKAFAIQKKEFSFAELKESALPVCLAAFEERNFSNVECCTHQMFVGLIQRLVSEGLVFLRDAEKDIYEVVSTEFIVDFMKRTFKFYGPTLLLGDLLQYSLSLLLDESEIVEVSKDCYRLFGEIMTEL